MASPAKLRYPTPHHEAADGLMDELSCLARDLQLIQADCKDKVNKVLEIYASRVDSLRARISGNEKKLLALEKRRKKDFFTDGDRLDLRYGSLVRQLETRVKRVKGMLTRLEEAGITEAIKIAKSVDWDQVEHLEDEQLAVLGTERKSEEVFGYELR